MNRLRDKVLSTAALLTLTLAPQAARAQGFNAVTSKDGIDVIAVGDAGAVYRSFNRGATFASSTIGNKPLRGVAHQGLTAIVVGDSGKVWRSTNNGGGWSIQVIAGTPALRGISMPTALVAYVVGDAGTILKSVDGGASWSPQTSGTGLRLNAVTFTDASNGWVAGAGGTLLQTVDGGANWAPVALGTTNDLYAVAQNGTTVWVGGAFSTAFRSTTGGSSWTQINLHADARPDVRAIMLSSPTNVTLGGGGGYIRKSADNGATWTFVQHDLHGPISSLWWTPTKSFATTSAYKVVLRDTSVAKWPMMSGATVTRTWQSVRSLGAFRGATVYGNWYDSNILYVMSGGTVYQSRDRGETWAQIGNTAPNSSAPNAFMVSNRDTNVFIAATTLSTPGTPRVIYRSEDRGVTWTTVLTHAYGTYGIPLEQHPDKPDTLVFGGDNDVLYRSIDRGKTWSGWGTKVFRSPCDIIILPDSSNVWQVGDGITGSGIGDLWSSTDGGQNFTFRQNANGSEIPGMSSSRLRNSYSIGTTWSSTGARYTSDYGTTWPLISALPGYGQSWGTDTNRDDPNVILVGQYSGGQTELSLDGGVTYQDIALSGTNYSFYALDRANLFAEMASALYKMRFSYSYTPTATQSLAVSAPNGGESWAVGSVHNITWSAANVGLARIEWRKSPSDPWTEAALVEGYLGTYAWTVPDEPTATAEVRVSDAWDASPTDVSNAVFTILGPRMLVTPGSLTYGTHDAGTQTLQSVTVQNTGTSNLDVTSVSTGTPEFYEGRTAFTLAPGNSDTVGVTFAPSAAVPYSDVLAIASNAGAANIPLSGTGSTPGSLSLTSPDGGQQWKYGTSQAITWSASGITSIALDYRTSPLGSWTQIVDNVPAGDGTYSWTIPNAPTTTAAVRVRDMGGSFTDASNAEFAITVPAFAGQPAVLDLGDVEINTKAIGSWTIDNPGTAFLGVLSVSSDRPTFTPGRTAFTVNAAATDTLSVSFVGASVGPDSATFTFTTDDPATPHTLKVRANVVHFLGVGDSPLSFSLTSAPNPFGSRTFITFALPRRAPVRLDVYDVLGHRVATLANGEHEPGTYRVPFGSDARSGGMPAGVYFVRMQAGPYTRTLRLLRMN